MKKIVTLSVLSLGVLFLTGCGQQPVSQTQPTAPAPVAQTPAQPVTPASDETAGWQTYTNNQYGYQIKYPQGWTVAGSDPGVIGFRTPNKKLRGGDFEADVYITFETSGIQDIINFTGSQFSDRKVSKEDIIIGKKNVPAVKLTVSTPSIPDWISHHLLVGMGSGVLNVNDGAQNTPEFWKIASTLELTR